MSSNASSDGADQRGLHGMNRMSHRRNDDLGPLSAVTVERMDMFDKADPVVSDVVRTPEERTDAGYTYHRRRRSSPW